MRLIQWAAIVAMSSAASAKGQIEATVYDVGTPTDSGGSWASGGCIAYDDVTFGGPGTAGAIDMSAISIAVILPVSPPATLHMRLSFYPVHVCGGNPPYSGVPVTTSTAAEVVGDFGIIHFVQRAPVSLRLDDTNVFGPGDRTAGLLIELFEDAAMTQYALNCQIVRRANIPMAGDRIVLPVGSSDAADRHSTNPPALN